MDTRATIVDYIDELNRKRSTIIVERGDQPLRSFELHAIIEINAVIERLQLMLKTA